MRQVSRWVLVALIALPSALASAQRTGAGTAAPAVVGTSMPTTIAGELIIEPPTLIALGFEWMIDGDDNRTAQVALSYRKNGESAWKEGLPLLRLQHERVDMLTAHYVAPNMFAGSIFDLEPDTEYEVRLVLSDADGVTGQASRVVTARTRSEPQPFSGGRVFHVYPPGHQGDRQQPAFTSLMAAYFMASNSADGFNMAPPRVQPGDTIVVHAGLYKTDLSRYGGALGTAPSDGTYFLTQSGTPDRPIVIKAAGDGEVIFNGDGAHNLFNVMAANYNYFEGLTIRNTNLAFLAGLKNITGARGLTFKRNKFENIGRGIYTDWSGSKDFYVADNVFLGRNDPKRLMGWIGATWKGLPGFPAKLVSEYAVKVYGSGHVIAHNYIAHFHDGIDHATYGYPDGTPNPIRDRLPVAIDIYNNDISNVDDNCVEADGAVHNIRVLRNRCFNHGHRSLSTQPVFGGPAYFIRNIVYHAPEGGAAKMTGTAAGVLWYHNTLFAPLRGMSSPLANLHFRNNLVLGRSETPEIFAFETSTSYSSSDYNGFRPNEDAKVSFMWSTPPPDVRADFGGKLAPRTFATLKEYAAATGQDAHSILIDYDSFVKAAPPDRNDPTRLYDPAGFDFRLRAGSPPIDAGQRLPGVNDGFTGKAPDLGAYEAGAPLPHYGPRP